MKNLRSTVLLAGFGLLALSTLCSGQEGGTTESRATKVTSKAMGVVKTVSNKSNQGVEKAADGLTVSVERFVNPPPHQPGQSNLLLSAGGGIGRLARNVTIEVARSLGTFGKGAVDLLRHSTAAFKDTMRQTANRITFGRSNGTNVQSESSSSGQSDDQQASEVNEAGASGPNELNRV